MQRPRITRRGALLPLLALAALAAVLLLSAGASATTVYVDDSYGSDDPAAHQWTTIQKGVYDAAPGDTVFVYNGSYSQNTTVHNASVTIEGESRAGVVIDLQSLINQAVIRIEADFVTIRNMTLKRGDYGIRAMASGDSNVTLENLTIQQIDFECITNPGASSWTLHDLTLSNCGRTGIDFSTGTANSQHRMWNIAMSAITGSHGLYLQTISYSTLNNITVQDASSAGIDIYDCRQLNIDGFSANSSGNYGAYIYISDNIRIHNATFTNTTGQGMGVYAYGSDYLEFEDVYIADNQDHGAYLYADSYMRWRNVAISQAASPFFFQISASPSVWEFQHDIDLTNTINGQPIVYFSNASGASYSGPAGMLVAANSTGLSVSINNTISGLQYGVLVEYTTWSNFSGVNASGNGYNFFVDNSNYNTFYQSMMSAVGYSGGPDGGIYVRWSSYNLFEGGYWNLSTRNYFAIDLQPNSNSNNNSIANVTCVNWNVCVYIDRNVAGTRIDNITTVTPNYAVLINYAADIYIDRSRFTNSQYYSVYLQGSTADAPSLTVRNSTFARTQAYDAIFASYAGSGLIENNSFNDTDYALRIYYSDHMFLQDNQINNSRICGIYSQYSDYASLYRNTIRGSAACAVGWHYSSYWTLRDNIIPNTTRPFQTTVSTTPQYSWFLHDVDTSNMVNGLPVLYVVNTTAGTFSGAYGWIVVSNSSNVTVTSSTNLSRNEWGLFLFDANDSTFNLINATTNDYGVYGVRSYRNLVSGLRAERNLAGAVVLWQASWNTFMGNYYRPDTNYADYGLYADDVSENNTIEGLDCSSFSACVYIDTLASHTSVLNSTINASYEGVLSYARFGPRVEWVTMNYSAYYPVEVYGSSGFYTRDLRVANCTFNGGGSNNGYYAYVDAGAIEDNTFRGALNGLYFYDVNNVVVARNLLTLQSQRAIESDLSDYLVLLNNTFDSGGANSDGIYMSRSSYWLMRGNVFSNQWRPYVFSFAVPIPTLAYVTHDTDSSNIANGNPVRWWNNATGVTFNGSAGFIVLTNSTGMNISATNAVTMNVGAVYLFGTNGSTIQGISMSANDYGVGLYHSHNNTLRDLHVWGNRYYGVYMAYSTYNLVLGGDYRPDAANQDYGIYFADRAQNNTVSASVMDFSGAVYMEDLAFDNAVLGGTYNDSYYGVISYAYGGTRVENATFYDSIYYHVYVQGGGASTSFAKIANNSMERSPSYYAIYVYNHFAGSIEDNRINSTADAGIIIQYSGNILMARNNITNAGTYGIYFYGTLSPIVIDNVVTQSQGGFEFYDTRYGMFSGNLISGLTAARAVYFSFNDPVTDATPFMHTWTATNLINGQPVRYYVNATNVTFSGPAGWLVAVNSSFLDLSTPSLLGSNYFGVLLVRTFNTTIQNIVINNTYSGVGAYWGADNRFINIVSNASAHAIYLSNNTRATIDRGLFANASTSGVYSNFPSTRLNITNTTFWMGYRGVYLDYRAQYTNVTNCTFFGQSYIAFYSEATDDVRLVNNTVEGAYYYGFYLGANSGDHADRIYIAGNRINNTIAYDGLVAIYVYAATIEYNNITYSGGTGIYLQASNGNLVRANTVRYASMGLYLSSSDSNRIVANTVSNSSWTLYLPAGTDFNEIYHNSFFLASGSTYDLGSLNLYDNGYPAGGNYWSNTTHTDNFRGSTQSVAGPDGINDTRMNLRYGKVDLFPLSEPWPPYLTLASPANLSVIRAGVTIDFNISAYFDTVQISLNNGTTSTFAAPYDLLTGGLPDGPLFVRIWANDTWYNLTPTLLFMIDSTPPTISADSPAPGGVYAVGTQLNFTVSDPNLVANVTWSNGGAPQPFTAPWDLSTSGWAEGDYNITIVAWDLAGNNRTTVFPFALDSTAPLISLASPLNGSFIAAGTIIDIEIVELHLTSATWNNGGGPVAFSAPFNLSTASWGSGTFNLTIIAMDGAGLSSSALYTFTIDATPPSIALGAPANNSVFESGQLLDFNVADGNLLAVTYDLGAGPVAFPAPFDLSTSGWADGSYDITIVANDTAGNVASTMFHFEVDNLAPAITVPLANGTFVAQGAVIDFSISEPHLQAVTWSNGGANNALPSPFDVPTSGWADGNYTIVVNATDTLGHASSRSLLIRIDSVAPAISMTSPSNNSYVPRGTGLAFSISDAFLNTSTWDNGSGAVTFGAPYTVTTSAWAEASFNITVIATDLAGNQATAVFRVTFDSTPPAITLDGPSNNSYIRPGATINLTVSDANMNYTLRNNGSGDVPLSAPWDISTAAWTDGTYTVQVWAVDLAGNAAYFTVRETVDGTLPAVNLGAPANNSFVRAGSVIDLAVADTNLGAVNYDRGTGATAITAPFDITVGAWGDGSTNITVTASDLAGNVFQVTFRFTVDSTAPAIALDGPANNSYMRPGATINLTVSEANLNFTLRNNGSGNVSLASPWDISTAGWSDGTYTVQVWAFDLAGNSVYFTVRETIDGTLPTVTLTSPANNSFVRAGSVINLSAADTNLNAVSYDIGSGSNTLTSPFDITVGTWSDGQVNVAVTASDLAGNVFQVTYRFTVDSTLPSISLNSPSAGAMVVAGTTIDLAVTEANLVSVTFDDGAGPVTIAAPFDRSTSGWSDGLYSVVVHAVDAAGNDGWLNFTITIDSTLPAITLVAPASGAVIRAGTAISLNISDANLATVTWDNGPSGAQPFAVQWTIATDTWFEGTYNVTIIARDGAGNSRTSSFAFTIDNTAPQLTLVSPANGSWLRAGAVIDFAVTELNSPVVNVTGAPTPLLAGYNLDTTGWADGQYNLAVSAADAAGNLASLFATFRLDSTAPQVASNAVNGTSFRAGTTIIFTINEANLQRALWRNQTGGVFAPFASNFSLSTAGWPEGNVSVIVQAQDFAGNVVNTSFQFFIDSIDPVVAVVTPPSLTFIRSDAPLDFTIVDARVQSIRAYLGPYNVSSSLTLNPDGSYRVDLSILPQGPSVLSITVTDATGNTATLTVPFTVDNTAPELPASLTYMGGNEDAPFTFQAGVLDALAPFDALIFQWTFDPDERLMSIITLGGNTSTWNFTEPGYYNVSLSVTDPAGNQNNTTYNINVFDITPPSVIINTTYITWDEDVPFSITQSSTDNGNGTLNWTWSEPTSNLTVYSPNITWVFPTPGLYNITLVVSDPSNNSALGYVVVNVRDRTAPVIELIGPGVTDLFITAYFQANVTDNDPGTSYANWTIQWEFTNATGTYQRLGRFANFTTGTPGTVTVRLTVIDASGNIAVVQQPLAINVPPLILGDPPVGTNVSEPWTWEVPTFDVENGTSPNVTIISGPQGMNVTGHTLTWTPLANQTGPQNVSISFTDGLTTVFRNFTLYVGDPAQNAGNHPPYFVTDPLLDARVERQYDYVFEAWDDDSSSQNSSIQYFIAYSSEPGFRISALGRHLLWDPPWTPSANEIFMRNVTVSLIAFDGFAYANQTFTIRFRNPPNQWPVLEGTPSVTECLVNETRVIHLKDYWHDPDDSITLLSLGNNGTAFSERAAIARIVGWRIDRTNPEDPLAIFTCVGVGEIVLRLVAVDPSGGTSEDSAVAIHVGRETITPPGLPPWLLYALIAGIAAVGLGAVVAIRRSRSATMVAQEALKTASNIPKAVVQPAEPLPPAGTKKDTYVIEALFIIYQDGRLIHSRTDISSVKFEDPDLVASMFSAVQSFIKDSFGQGELNRLGFGENTIMIGRANQTFMACVIYGEPTVELVDGMTETLRTIENAFAGIIENWDGSTDNLAGIEQYVEPFLATTAHLTRADVKQSITEKGVKMISELEFFQGFVRLKCGVKNDTDSVITKVTVSIDFNEDVLRLHHVEPDGYKRQGSEVQMGVLNAQEKGSLAYYFDPQICTESMIDGVARYRDAKGGVHSVNMKTRKAEVVCPIFFTKEHANTAMLKRLVEGELDQRDSKVYTATLPEGTKWPDLFALLKEVVMSHDVHSVREFVTEEPYQAEAWFYGETKVKGYKIVIRTSVHAADNHIEFFAASTQIPAITGLLAEFNHTLQKRAPGKLPGAKLVPEFDEGIKNDVQKRSLMPKVDQAELEGGETDQQD